ncbi:YgiW/YdeI family stress tolerance OB fold protein [Glaesserella sp.]|uniref:YgiW/YdeI family stress tolerance OB fold protein n=1 Tax=Glaesserella sp. TaxID=2094731 RepID=UPI0035A04602
MKKLMSLSLLAGALVLTACSNPYANQQQFGANVPSSVISVKQALSAYDDSYVTLEGSILDQVDNDEYILADSSGQIRVEIDNHVWQGKNVSSENVIRVYGEIDREWNKTELKVRELTILR